MVTVLTIFSKREAFLFKFDMRLNKWKIREGKEEVSLPVCEEKNQ